ncbi:hypothetical protein RUM44_005841 [Polyplax serrata]|uniref:Vacuolar protein sorting-associated protein 33B n=1 Tax=Polyplax serrata TaxID=468196 RepID=A0ABR1AY84_POLSC
MHGVDKMYKLDRLGGQECNSTTVYLIKTDLITAKVVCNQINSHFSAREGGKFHIILIPKMLTTIEVLFEEEGLFGRVHFHIFAWELIQLDSKILSFEAPKIYKHLFVRNDQSFLTSIAKSIWSLCHVFGKPPLSIFHGKYSNLVSSLLEHWLDEAGAPDRSDSDIGCMLVLDRDVDYAPVLMMPGTYTALISEVMNLSTGTVEIKEQNNEKRQLAVNMLLTSEDEIYNQIKNKHFSDVNVYLKQKANELITEKNKGANMSIQEMKNFVEGQLGKLRNECLALSNHFNICEKICNEMGQKFESFSKCQNNILYGGAKREVIMEIEDMMGVSDDMFLVLRLICLLSLVQNGLTADEANSLKKQFLHSYGHCHLSTFYNLEKCGLFMTPPYPGEISMKIATKVAQVVPFPKKNTFQLTAQKLKLIPDISETYCLKNPQDAGYVFGGAYIPIVAQIVNYLIRKEMSLKELIKCMPGNINCKPETKLIATQVDGAPDINPRTILVYFVGGITYAEIAALQFLEARMGCRILCCGSSIINAKSMLRSAIVT